MAGYDPEKMRAAMRKQMGGRSADPNEFRPPKATDGQLLKYRFYILPPYSKGDTILGGTATRDMDLFSVTDAQHWADKKPYGCPRVISGDELECEMCATGFKLKSEAKSSPHNSDAIQAQLSRSWLPTTNRLVNIYFPPVSTNPEELRDRVMWFKANQTIYGMWYSTMMREDSGPDEEDPLAYGMFFDENSAFLFNLIIDKDGQYNGYKQSKFIVTDKTGALACGPVVRKSDGSADNNAIKKILDRRHDLHSKIDGYDVDAITKLARRLMDASQGDDGGFDSDEVASKPSSKATNSRRPPVVEDDDEPVVQTKRQPKPVIKPEDDGDDVVQTSEALSGESPLVDDEDDTPAIKQAVAPKANGKAASSPKVIPKATSDEADSDNGEPAERNEEVDALLDQLNSDDD